MNAMYNVYFHICVAMDLVLIPPSSCFIKRIFSILRSCMDGHESDHNSAATLLKTPVAPV